MSNVVLKAENIAKQYRLGQLGTGTISHDLNRLVAKLRGKEDPYLKIGEANDRSQFGGSDYVWSLKDINFEVKQGEVLGIIGKNGAGKSTLLKILSQVTTPTTGQVKVKGRIAALLEVGTGFHPDLSGRENIFLNGAILGMTKVEIKSKLDEIVDFSGVAKYLDTPVKRYSSGMMVRLGFAVAAHLEPEILIVDEVLAVGDAEFQEKCLGKMKNVSGQGRTVLFVSHNMAAIKSLCKRTIVLKNGETYFDGNVVDGITKYLEALNPSINKGAIEKHHRTVNTGFVFIKSVSLENEEFANGNSIYFNNEIGISCQVEFLKDISNVLFDIRIMSADGIEILHSMNIYENNFVDVKKGMVNTNVILENRLQPGKYFITIGVHLSDGLTLDYLENILEINVLNVAKNNQKGLIYDFKLGYVRPHATWKIN
ncbi:MAG: ABC transporter ATP-binding protein [Bacteroidia bacterium]|nr:ABC transporter ATP-binding protein [Bacteroidia bacterium]